MKSYRLTRFACGHVGRNNEGSGTRRKVTEFIRVAQIGSSPLEESEKNCPNCGKSK